MSGGDFKKLFVLANASERCIFQQLGNRTFVLANTNESYGLLTV